MSVAILKHVSRFSKGRIRSSVIRCSARTCISNSTELHRKRILFRRDALVPNEGVLLASIATVGKLSLICFAVDTLLRNDAIPTNSSTVLSKISFFLLLPSTLFVRVGTMLSTQASCLTVLFICFASAVQILLGLSIGYFLSKLVSAKFDTAQTKTSSCNSHYPNPSKYELENFVTVACAFGNPWALATLFLTTLFPNQSESVQGLVALFLLCWNPLFWTLGQFILSAASVQTTSHQDFLQKIRSVLQPPTMGLLAAVLVCLAPAGRRLFTTCSVSEVAGAGLVSTGVVICVRFVLEVMRSLSTATMPIQTIILGTALSTSTTKTNHTLNNDIPKWMPPIWNNASEATAFGLIALGRFLILPAVNWIVLNLLNRFGVLVEDRICRVMLFAMSVMPPAQNLVLALNLKSETRHLVPLAARFLLGWYLLSIVPVTIWVTSYARFG